MNELTEKYFKALFFSKPSDFMKLVKELNELERKELNDYYKKIISLLRKSCKYDQNKSNPQYDSNIDTDFGTIKKVTTNPDIKTYYQYLLENIDNLEVYLREKSINFFFSPNSDILFYNLSIFSASILDFKSLKGIFKLNSLDFRANHERQDNPHFYYILEAFLVRNSDKVKPIIVSFYENVEKNYNAWSTHNYKMLMSSLLLIIKTKPEWEVDFKPYLGKCLVLELTEKELTKFSPEIILSALNYLPTSNEIPLIIDSGYWSRKAQILELIKNNYLPKKEVIEITLNKIISSVKPVILREWIKFYNDLEITKEEKPAYQSLYFKLITSINSTSIQLGLSEIKHFLKEKTFTGDYEELVINLAYNLNNPVKKIIDDSFKLLKWLFINEKQYKTLIIDNLLNNLSIPDKTIRTSIIDFIIQQDLTQVQKHTLSDFYSLNDLLPNEKEKLETFLKLENTDKQVVVLITIKEPEKEKILVNPIYQKNYEQIFDAVKNNNFTNIKPITIDSPYKYGNKLKLSQDEIEVALKIKESEKKWNLNNEYEIAFAEVLKYRNVKNKEKLVTLLKAFFDPFSKTETLNQPYNMYHFQRILFCSLIYHWLKEPSFEKFSYEKLKNTINASPYINKSILRRFLKVKDILENDYDFELLSTPTYETGWIDAEDFYQKLIKTPTNYLYDYEDLIISFFRITNDNLEINKKILLDIERVDNVLLKNAFILRFGSDDESKKAVSFFVEYFKKNQPDDTILINIYGNYNDLHISEKNMFFRFFNASLLGKYGLIDFKEKFPDIANISLQKLVIHDGTSYISNFAENILDIASGKVELSIKKTEELTYPLENYPDLAKFNFINKMFFAPETNYSNLDDIRTYLEESKREEYVKKMHPFVVNQSYYDEKYFSLILALFTVFAKYNRAELMYYPQFLPYMNRRYGFITFSNKEACFYDTWRLPSLSQIFFDLTSHRIKKTDINDFSKTEPLPKLMAFGEFLEVDLTKDFYSVLNLLVSKQLDIKTIAFNIIEESLKTGRITTKIFIDSLSKLLLETNSGFKYLKESLDSLCVMGELYEKSILLAIEKYLADLDLNNINSKNVSNLLDFYYNTLLQTNSGISSQKTIDNLHFWAEAKKKNILTDKAKNILALKGNKIVIEEVLLNSFY